MIIKQKVYKVLSSFKLKMGRIITVEEGRGKSIDFSKDDALYTAGLEACVAVAGRNGDKGALMHLTQLSDLNHWFDWFYDVLPPEEGNRVYLVGGHEKKSFHFVPELTGRLNDYKIAGQDLHGPFWRHMKLFKDRVEVEYVKLWMSPGRELEWLNYGGSVLP